MDSITRLLLDDTHRYIFSLKAKDVVMQKPRSLHVSLHRDAPQSSLPIVSSYQSSHIPELEESDDGEDSASTLLLDDLDISTDLDENDDTSTCASTMMDISQLLDELLLDDEPVVHFCTPLVTHMETRPRTTAEDKKSLYYSESEYRRFRREYAAETNAAGTVIFHDQVVTEVWEYEAPADPSVLYYSETELQA